MKPKPLSSLNHLTVPVATYGLHGGGAVLRSRRSLWRRLRCGTALRRSFIRPDAGKVAGSAASDVADAFTAAEAVGMIGGDRVPPPAAKHRIPVSIGGVDPVVP